LLTLLGLVIFAVGLDVFVWGLFLLLVWGTHQAISPLGRKSARRWMSEVEPGKFWNHISGRPLQSVPGADFTWWPH